MKNTFESDEYEKTDSETQAFIDMQLELESGECATIHSPAWNSDTVFVCGKCLGTFATLDQALRAIRTEFNRIQFWGNVYFVNERGNVTHLHPDTGAEINSWV